MLLDDEALARIGLLHSINWEEHGYHIVGEAGNITDALALARQTKPDIVLVDIILRNENGLCFIEELQKTLPLTRFILISCADETEFYRKAISLHVDEFISKSDLSGQELLAKLDHTARKIYQERVIVSKDDTQDYEYINRHSTLSSYINQYLSRESTDTSLLIQKLSFYNIALYPAGYFLICLKFPRQKLPLKDTLEASIITLCYEILADLAEGYIFRDYQQHIIFFISAPKAPLSPKWQETLCYRLTSTIFECLNLHTVSGISKWMISLKDFHTAWEQAIYACDQNYILHERKICFYEPESTPDAYIRQLETEKEQALSIARVSQMQMLLEYLEHIYRLSLDYPCCNIQVIQGAYLEILNHILNVFSISLLDFESLVKEPILPAEFLSKHETLRQMHEALYALIMVLSGLSPDTGKNRLILEINEYISSHLNQHISLADISSYVHFTPSYLSRYYKKQTGMNLKDYIMDCKIHRAIQMLKEGVPVSLIAEQLSFCSSSHFIHVFKEKTGQTPNAYISS